MFKTEKKPVEMKDAIHHYNSLIAMKIRKTEYPDKVRKCSNEYQLNAQGALLIR
jgi:hypothetical protein